jgi:RHS repeat-associated protein
MSDRGRGGVAPHAFWFFCASKRTENYDDQGFRVHKIAAEIIDGTDSQVEVLYPSMYFAIEQQRTPNGEVIPNTSYACNNIYLNGIRIAASLPNGECQYYLTDQVDSVSIVTDDSGKVVTRNEYLPYGETWVQEGDSKNRPKYNSQELDAETNFYFYNARYYDGEVARFVTADNVVDGEYDTQGWNRYSYCKNNPVVYKDPTGHVVPLLVAGVVAAVVLTPKPTTNDMSDEEADKANEEYKEEVAMSIASALIPGGSNIKTIVNASRKAQKVHDKQTKSAGKGNNSKGEKRVVRSAEEVNEAFKKDDLSSPYKPGTKIREYTTEKEEAFVRVHGGKSSKEGRWIMKKEAIQDLSPEQIKNKYSLPNKPTSISDVEVPLGSRIRTGKVNSNFGGGSGAKQYELLDKIPDENFKNSRPLK